MRGKTLEEKRFGPGFRPILQTFQAIGIEGCGVEGCGDMPVGSVELYVDDYPQVVDWYTRILAKLPSPGAWWRVPFCLGHLEDVCQRSLDVQEEPDIWAPGRENPFVLLRPFTLFQPIALPS